MADIRRFRFSMAFFIYCLISFYFIFIGARTVSELSLVSLLQDNTNLIPMKTIGSYMSALAYSKISLETVLTNTIGNVIFAIPLGMLLPSLFKRTHTTAAVVTTACAVSFVLEFAQLVLKLGSFDIDAIILRGAGAAIGFLLYKLAASKASK